MNLTTILAYASSAFAALFVLAAPFSKRQTLSKWVFSLGMLALATEQFLAARAQQSGNPLEIAYFQQLRFFATAALPGLWFLFACTYARGDIFGTLRRRGAIIVFAFAAPLAIVWIGADSLVVLKPHPKDPFRWISTLGWSGFGVHFLFLLAMVGSLVSLERTYRASVGTLRWKIKFMLYGIGTLFAARFFSSSQVLLVQQVDPTLDAVDAIALIFACLLVTRSLVRPGSFDIDLYPSQSVITGSLTITLAGTYLFLVGIVAKVVSAMGGDHAFAIKTIIVVAALVALGILIQSDRFRQLIRRFVSRNFQRPLYDYRTLWLRVTDATSQSVRREDICQTTTRMLATLLDTKLTNIWILDTSVSRFLLVASTDQTSEGGERVLASPLDDAGISPALLRNQEPFDIEPNRETWAEAIKASNPSSFDDGGHRILVPLVGRGTVVGFILLGDRTNTLNFTQQEFDTLKCIADHIAASLLSAELTRKLEQSKEIEAFQTMATFFVHDLKNAVSTLNLMLKNMPQHWDNPEFREDALKGIGGTSQRITQLITRLGQVRSESRIAPQPADLAAIAREALSQWHPSDTVELVAEIEGEYPIFADKEKAQSVITNLLINASEAMGHRGKIAISLSRIGDWAHLVVADNGPGMSADFLANSLFRPFKTTKKGGLGIGMFQSKTVMEAHGGSISAQSREGEGATFTLRFPIRSSAAPVAG